MIWCQGGNPRSASLAVSSGWFYGFRSDDNHHADRLGPVCLLDIDWKKPNWDRHLALARRYRPWLAAVPDILNADDTDRAMEQAEEIASACGLGPLVIPKVPGVIPRLPREIDGKPLVLGYSVPTSYGGSELALWDYRGRPVHLLGGNPRRQLDCMNYLDVVSADGNLAWRLARQGIIVTDRGVAGPTLRQADGHRWPVQDAHLEALRRSLINLKSFWNRLLPAGRIDWQTQEG
jgi:hypothetical protein